MAMFLGMIPGAIGEVSKVAILVGLVRSMTHMSILDDKPNSCATGKKLSGLISSSFSPFMRRRISW